MKKQASISFVTRALECQVRLEDVESRIMLWSGPYSCPPALTVSGKSVTADYNHTSACLNKLCNQRVLHAIAIKDLALSDLHDILKVQSRNIKVCLGEY